MKKTGLLVVGLLLAAVLIAAVPLLTIHNSEFGGADGAAEDAITQIDPDYTPWMESVIAPPGGETESLLFCLQAGLGSAVLGFGFGYLIARKKYQKQTGQAGTAAQIQA
ncbi:energy-coupling factor ABC transporter substrate-binding protein [Neobittarella massiliensis]|uniref:Cobalt transport protein CbiN n=2 Tax=Oscillospiraceae TaxID=216572 RepID=A0A8J6LUQ8_9FIRM|nr:energy-coupling factor ABC transporter substrate-binding protein [Neobittarella massiliensis]MBC3517024.1 energy-coupling factor ABC transporter substrate-binding protein [Neobittarella massiliensis]SCJ89527.1 Energy-coupling factor transporter probable substrate-capture protein CbiN [uncultured Anaerotruncus sp.]